MEAGENRAGDASHMSGTNLERAGDHNQRVTLHAIRVGGPIKRTELAALTGLTAASIANITRRLLADGLILEAGREQGGRGQPATRLVVNPDSCFSIGVNIDRDHITIVLVDFIGRIRARASRDIAYAMPDQVRELYRTSVQALARDAKIDPALLVGIGIALPDDIARTPLPNLPAGYDIWQTVSVAGLVREPYNLPVYVENDAAAAAMGEMQFGLGQRYQSFFYILITAALGGGMVVDGQYFRGADGRSGELGFLLAANAGGQPVQLQNLVSLSELYRRLAQRGYVVTTPGELIRGPSAMRAIVDAWIEEASAALVDPLVSIDCLINPGAVLIGGRLPSQLVERLAARLNERRRPLMARLPSFASVVRAQTSEDAPAVGAAILPIRDLFLPKRSALMKVSSAALG